jgi:inorganic pyrophosphatase
LKVQLIGSTVILLGVTYVVTIFSFPETSTFISQTGPKMFDRWVPYVCSILGLISGMIIAAFTEYVTSHAYSPVRGLA